jgi:hypothetical protein
VRPFSRNRKLPENEGQVPPETELEVPVGEVDGEADGELEGRRGSYNLGADGSHAPSGADSGLVADPICGGEAATPSTVPSLGPGEPASFPEDDAAGVAPALADDTRESPSGGGEPPEGEEGRGRDAAGIEKDTANDSGRARKVPVVKTRVDSGLVKRLWRANSLGRIALTCVALFAVLVTSAYFLLMQPADRRLHEVSEAKSLLQDYAVIQQAGATVGSFKDGLMVGDQRLTVLSEVNLMAEGAGVRIVGDPELLLRRDLSGHFSEYPVRLRLKGSYHKLGEFLSLLESSPRFIVVESVEVTSDVASASKESDATVLLAFASWEG